MAKTLTSVTICGYSERGAFSALLHEISYSDNAAELLRRFLNLIKTPGRAIEHKTIVSAEVLLEPSLSDFGDADAVALIDGADGRRAIFFEGKVKSSQKATWTVQDEWIRFKTGLSSKLDSSNLFTQLYHKVRFVSALKNTGVRGLQQGIEFPGCSSKNVRKIGKNPVVLRATDLISQYVGHIQYVAVVPDSLQHVDEFFTNELPRLTPQELPGWDISGWGYLCWSDVEMFCRQNGLVNSIRVFEFNYGQIY